MTKKISKKNKLEKVYKYIQFDQIDGRHELKQLGQDFHVGYYVYPKEGGNVCFFNFKLAKEMGLIEKTHHEKLNLDLKNKILETFALQILNEYDVIHKPLKEFVKKLRPNRYMATRYLQLQHQKKDGSTSGDGRSMWNGQFTHGGLTWDVSSCGVGATCLSPAVANQKKYYRTGDPHVSYGCGHGDVMDGLAAAVLSEIFYQNGVSTERVLAVIHFPGDRAIVIRAAKNLIRPSHMFNHLKQKNINNLKQIVDYAYIRQLNNSSIKLNQFHKEKYHNFLLYFADTFAKISAQFEREYIFCWLDWDGDNILLDGGIIDYGSVRQFGLFHHEYRYDDVDRFSTNILEQKNKARLLVQIFHQTISSIQDSKKANFSKFSKGIAVRFFEKKFVEYKSQFLLLKIGFNLNESSYLIQHSLDLVRKFENVYRYFEKQKSSIKRKLPDGITYDAYFCLRDILRELPTYYVNKDGPMEPETFLEILKSDYAPKSVLKLNPSRVKRVDQFQEIYWSLIEKVAMYKNIDVNDCLVNIEKRSKIINQKERITGDSVIFIAQKILEVFKSKGADHAYEVFKSFIAKQNLKPELQTEQINIAKEVKKLCDELLEIVTDYRETI